MTRATLEWLKTRKRELEDSLRSAGSDADSGHQRAAVHDDQATEQLKNQRRAELERIGDLRFVVPVEPRTETDSIGIGNRVDLLCLQPKDQLSALVLPADDSTYAERTGLGMVITPESPIGKAIIGKAVGEEVEVNTKPPKRIKIRAIKPGDF